MPLIAGTWYVRDRVVDAATAGQVALEVRIDLPYGEPGRLHWSGSAAGAGGLEVGADLASGGVGSGVLVSRSPQAGMPVVGGELVGMLHPDSVIWLIAEPGS